MRFVCESCRAQYMINDEKVGPKGVKVRCRKCGYVILVKRADAAKNGPVPMSNDPDDALATQVMQTPLSPADATLSNEDPPNPDDMVTNPGVVATAEGKGPKDSFFGADEDEIGAVFDQVLKGGGAAGGAKDDDPTRVGSPDDRQSTRVIDADTVRKLAEESGVVEKAPVEAKSEEVPTTDWYVAINEKQTGPLTLEKVKEHWDNGEIGPDSLCWRAGFDDWIPLSTVKALASVLAPKPPKPIVVAPAATITQSNAPAMVSMPVQSAFSSGGMVQTVQSEVQVPMAAAAAMKPEETGSWKPSGATALASLVRDEMEALAKPPPKPAPVVEETPARGGGLLDLPPADEKPSTNAAVALPPSAVEDRAPRPPPPAPVNPYLANPGATYSAPAVTQYRPPNNNRNLMIGLAAGGVVLLLILIGLMAWIAGRQTAQPIVVAPPVQQPIAVAPPPQPVAQQPLPQPAPSVAQPVQPGAAQPGATPTTTPAEAAAVQPAVAAAGTPPPAQPGATPPAPVAVQPTPPPAPTQPAPVQPTAVAAAPKSTRGTPRQQAAREPAPQPAPEPRKASSKSGGDDDFESAFNPPKEEPAPKAAKKDVYVPAAPGTADVKERLEQGDIMEGVLAKKADLASCTSKKEAGTSGKIVMKWTVATSGKVTNVGVDSGSEDLKGTPMAACFAGVIKSMTFPKHKVQGEPVKFPFKY